jgi:hypothetical protein
MPADPNPSLLAHPGRLTRGALIRIARLADGTAGTTGAAPDPLPTALTFQYNPDSVTRSRSGSWEPRRQRSTKDRIGSPQEIRSRSGQGSAGLLAESETISLTLLFDATERILRGPSESDEDPSTTGVLPELAFLELVSLGREAPQARSTGGTATSTPTEIRAVRPDELLLQLGEQRWYPVVLTQLTITEQKFTPALVPIRAQVELKLNVLEPMESAYRGWIQSAFDELLRRRSASAGRLAPDAGTATAVASIREALDPGRGGGP